MPGHIYIAPWESYQDRQRRAYRPPAAPAIGVLDLRSLPQMAQPDQLGYGLFVYRDQQTIPGSQYLGADPQRQLTILERSAIETFLGVSLLESRFTDIVEELFLDHYDPSGQTARKPVRTSSRQGFVIFLGGFGAISRARHSSNHPSFNPTLEVRRTDYARLRAAGTPLTALRRWTGYEMLKLFGRLGDDLVAALVLLRNRPMAGSHPRPYSPSHGPLTAPQFLPARTSPGRK